MECFTVIIINERGWRKQQLQGRSGLANSGKRTSTFVVFEAGPYLSGTLKIVGSEG